MQEMIIAKKDCVLTAISLSDNPPREAGIIITLFPRK